MSGLQRKTIKKIITKKLSEWLESIEDKEVRHAANKDVIVTGGCIASMLQGEPVSDFDLYFRTKETTRMVAEYYVRKFNEKRKTGPKPIVREENLTNIKGESEDRVVVWVQSAGVAGEEDDNIDQDYEYFEQTDNEDGMRASDYIDKVLNASREEEDAEKEAYRPIFLSENAITLSNKVQIVIRFYGEPDQIHDNYDFVHATCYYDHCKNELHMPAQALESIMCKTLKYKGSLYPICSIFRTRKFIQRGWKISAGEMLKMAWQCTEIDLTDARVMREQLTGVDAAYFQQLISVIEHYKNEAEESGTSLAIDSTYVAELIDQIFDNT